MGYLSTGTAESGVTLTPPLTYMEPDDMALSVELDSWHPEDGPLIVVSVLRNSGRKGEE